MSHIIQEEADNTVHPHTLKQRSFLSEEEVKVLKKEYDDFKLYCFSFQKYQTEYIYDLVLRELSTREIIELSTHLIYDKNKIKKIDMSFWNQLLNEIIIYPSIEKDKEEIIQLLDKKTYLDAYSFILQFILNELNHAVKIKKTDIIPL